MDPGIFVAITFVSLVNAAICADQLKDHIFVFAGESLTIDCTGRQTKSVLQYRKVATDDPVILFYGDTKRTSTNLTARMEGNDLWYEIKAAKPADGGEYECDWTSENDETNHYVNVVDKESLTCPEVSSPVLAGEEIPGVNCSISKTGTLFKEWLNDESKAEQLGLRSKFTIQDVEGRILPVEYEETESTLKAKVPKDRMRLHSRRNNTALTCKFVSQRGTETTCRSEPIQVDCDESNVNSMYCREMMMTDSGNAVRGGAFAFLLLLLLLAFLLI